jgi:AraC-like DNA-binding protein
MSSPFHLSYFDPPEELARHILTTFCFATEHEGEAMDRHPGGLGQLVVFTRGRGEIEFNDRVDGGGAGAYLFCGFTAARPIRVVGPWTAIGVSLSPLGWAALTRQLAKDHMDRMPPAAEFLGDAVTHFADDLIGRYNAGEIDDEAACLELGAWVGEHLNTVPPAHERVIEATIGWLGSSLNPDLDQLFAQLPYSRRQGERLVERYFGLSPAALARKFRAVRAAALLSQKNLSDEAEAEIANAFVDQSHMIREIRRFSGYTPSRLGGPSDPIFHTMIRLKNLDRLKQFRAIG